MFHLRHSDGCRSSSNCESCSPGGTPTVAIPSGFQHKRGERALYISPGVNDALHIDEDDLEYANNAHFVHMDSFVSAEQLEMQKKFVKETSAAVSFAPGMMCSKFKFDVLKPIIESCRIVFLNEGKIRSLTGAGHRRGGEVLLDAGAKMVVVTLGKKGCYIANEGIHIAAPKAKVVDTTGAGDAFAAGFFVWIQKHFAEVFSLKMTRSFS